jgi:hypothetical protein
VCGISQASPFPCDNNKVTVSLSASRDVHAGCHPRVTITGLLGNNDEMFQNPDNTMLPITNTDDVSPVTNGAWVKAAGTLEFDLTFPADQHAARSWDVQFTFDTLPSTLTPKP